MLGRCLWKSLENFWQCLGCCRTQAKLEISTWVEILLVLIKGGLWSWLINRVKSTLPPTNSPTTPPNLKFVKSYLKSRFGYQNQKASRVWRGCLEGVLTVSWRCVEGMLCGRYLEGVRKVSEECMQGVMMVSSRARMNTCHERIFTKFTIVTARASVAIVGSQNFQKAPCHIVYWYDKSGVVAHSQ